MSTVTDFEIAECRLKIILSKNKVPSSWNQAPYYGKASVDTAGGYNGWCKIAYNFRMPMKKGQYTTATRFLVYIASNSGKTPSEIRKALNIDEGCNSALFTNAKLWMLIKSCKGKYYITSTGLKYLESKVGIKYDKVNYYSWKDDQYLTRYYTNHDTPEAKVRCTYADGHVSYYENEKFARAVETDKKIRDAAAGMITAEIKAKRSVEEIDNKVKELQMQIETLQKKREDIIEEQKRGKYIKINLDGRYKKEELANIFNEILENY